MYHIVFEKKPGDFMPVDIKYLTGNNYSKYGSLQELDFFTKSFTESKLREAIALSNTIPSDYLNGTLKIINDNKYRYEILYQDNTFALDEFLLKNIDNKVKMNKLVNIYMKYSKDNIDTLKMAIKLKDVREVLDIIFSLKYEQIRSIYIYASKHIDN